MKTNLKSLLVVFCVIVMACQKQQESIAETSDAENLNAVANTNMSASITADRSGAEGTMISEAAAQSMAKEYIKKFGSKETRSVSFSIKALKKYLAYLESKTKSDIVFVNFGIYNEKTAPTTKSINRLTVFFGIRDPFTYNSSLDAFSTNGVKNTAAARETTDFNHGGIYP